jgi:hypothetical protein
MRLALLTLLAAGPFAAGADATVSSVDPESGLATWQTETRGIQVRLTQISPDQARAFYQARGFSRTSAERYASECVFMTVVRNVGDTPLDYTLAEWRYHGGGEPPRPIRGKDEWEAIWVAEGVSEPARLAFNWAQIPAEQHYAPGDWNQGMTSYRLPHGAHFDLDFVWHAGGRTLTGTLEDAQCAAENP